MTLKEKFTQDGTSEVSGLAPRCLAEEVKEIGRDKNHVLSQMECGDYIVDVLGSGDTLLILKEEINEPHHADIKGLAPESAA